MYIFGIILIPDWFVFVKNINQGRSQVFGWGGRNSKIGPMSTPLRPKVDLNFVENEQNRDQNVPKRSIFGKRGVGRPQRPPPGSAPVLILLHEILHLDVMYFGTKAKQKAHLSVTNFPKLSFFL